ncbi:MAG TPA: hypothetical protein VFP32_00430 [Candidatus Saccharimonadales bacterium]|nr:hypothetical protein [Candidatus Saccharimonadales bacterium]
MNDEQLEDLKQFIDGRISQAETRFDNKLGEEIGSVREEIEALRKEMLDGFTGVGEAIDEINKHFDERISKLEQQAA